MAKSRKLRPKLKLPAPWYAEVSKESPYPGESGRLINEKTWHATGFICYEDGRAAFDDLVPPKKVRTRVETYCRRIVRHGPRVPMIKAY